jgi:hypothetical protein
VIVIRHDRQDLQRPVFAGFVAAIRQQVNVLLLFRGPVPADLLRPAPITLPGVQGGDPSRSCASAAPGSTTGGVPATSSILATVRSGVPQSLRSAASRSSCRRVVAEGWG